MCLFSKSKLQRLELVVKPKPDICWFSIDNDDDDRYFPDWFLEEILTRLPVKCVHRYKCVSKRWLSLISDPNFVSLYVSRAASMKPRLESWTILGNTLRVVEGNEFFAESLIMPDNYALRSDLQCPRFDMLHFPDSLVTSHDQGEKYTILAVSDGLVLYGNDDRRDEYRIYNAVTGDCIELPRAFMSCSGYISTGFLTETEEGGDLKSFQVVRFDCQFGESYILKFEVYSSETGKWRSVVVHTNQAIEIVWLRKPFAFNGSLHWVDRRLGVMAFSPSSDTISQIGLPAGIDKQCNDARNNGKLSLCDVHQGHLRYIEASVPGSYSCYPFGFSGFSVWILDDYNDSATWSLQHRVKVRDLSFGDLLLSRGLSRSIPTPIAFHPIDPDIVYLGLGDTCVSYNVKTSKLDALSDPLHYQDDKAARRLSTRKPCWTSTFLFILPSRTISIPVPSKEGDS